MKCYARGPVCPFECMPCDECPASNPEYAKAFEKSTNAEKVENVAHTTNGRVAYD